MQPAKPAGLYNNTNTDFNSCLLLHTNMKKSQVIDVYLLLGSNLGNKKQHINQAGEGIKKEIGEITAGSALYKTAPWGKTDQPDFINQAIKVATFLTPQQVLDQIFHIEKSLGRERTAHWGSRVIDIDILFYGNEVVNDPRLTIPHPHLHNRAFALLPLLEIAPEFIHPVFKQSIRQLRTKLSDNLSVEEIK